MNGSVTTCARLSLCAIVAFALAACGCPEPTASVDTSGTVPSFSWFGTDGYQLVVTGPGGVYWSLQCSTGRNCFSPPLLYDDLPEDAVEILAARPLDRGAYEVSLCALCDDDDIVRCGPATAFEIE